MLSPSGALIALAGLSVGAWFVAPSHPGPLAPALTLLLVLSEGPLVWAAARRSGLSSGGAVLAAASTVLLLTMTASDVVGVIEHAAVVIGLLAVVLWPDGEGSPARRRISGFLAGAAVAMSPLILLPVSLLAGRILGRRDTGRVERRTLLAPAGVGLAVAVAGVAVLLLVPEAVRSTVWGGEVEFATAVVVVAPTLGMAAGIGADAALAGLSGRNSRTLFAGVAGSLILGLVLAGMAGATVSQLRDRVIAADGMAITDENSAAGGASDGSAEEAGRSDATAQDSPSPTVTTDSGTARRADQGAQLLANPRLTTTPESRRLLAEGSVDPRIMIVLAQLLTAQDLTVADFPAVEDSAAEAGSVRRQLLVSEADGATLGTGGGSMPALSAYLSGLSDEFAVESVSVDSDGVLATFAPETE